MAYWSTISLHHYIWTKAWDRMLEKLTWHCCIWILQMGGWIVWKVGFIKSRLRVKCRLACWLSKKSPTKVSSSHLICKSKQTTWDLFNYSLFHQQQRKRVVSWSFATQQLVVLSHAENEAEGLLKHSQASLDSTTTYFCIQIF